MSGSEDWSGNLAHEAVSSLELELLGRGWPIGEPLGSLREVQAALGLGLPSCREAINILEVRGLLQIKCGRGGGLFVSLPSVEDVASVILVYLSFHPDIPDCIGRFRRVMWKMIAETAIDRGDAPLATGVPSSGKGFAVDLANRLGNRPMIFAAELAETLIDACGGPPPPAEDKILEGALQSGDRELALRRIEELVDVDLPTPTIKLEALERRLLRFKGKSALVLAARMAREFGAQTSESEWETATRLGYTDVIVRQARRILQDFGVMQCQQGRKGGSWAMPVVPAGVIRLLAACMVANGMDERAYRETATFFGCNVLPFAARQAALSASEAATLLAPFKDGHSRIDMLRTDNLILHINGNPLLAIFFRAVGLAQLFVGGAPPATIVSDEAARLNKSFLRAIERGDPESAAALASAKMTALRKQLPRRRTPRRHSAWAQPRAC